MKWAHLAGRASVACQLLAGFGTMGALPDRALKVPGSSRSCRFCPSLGHSLTSAELRQAAASGFGKSWRKFGLDGPWWRRADPAAWSTALVMLPDWHLSVDLDGQETAIMQMVCPNAEHAPPRQVHGSSGSCHLQAAARLAEAMIADLIPGDLAGLAHAVLHQGTGGDLIVGHAFMACMHLLHDVMDHLYKHEGTVHDATCSAPTGCPLSRGRTTRRRPAAPG